MSKRNQIDIEPYIIQSSKIYSLHNARKGGRDYLAKVFYQKQIQQQLSLDCMQYNEQVLTYCRQFLYNNHFLNVEYVYPHSQGFLFLTSPYQCRLNQYIQKKNYLIQWQALQIFQQILKTVACLYYEGYWHRHLRPQHFVKIGSTWKLQSLVFDNVFGINNLKSEYLWSDQFQCPQFIYNDKFSEQQLDDKIVWDLGCMLVIMIYGIKVTKSVIIKKRFKQQGYSPQIFDHEKKIKVSDKLQKYLSLMCHINPDKRLKFLDLLKIEFFSQEVSKLAQKYEKQRKSVKIFIRNKSSVSKIVDKLNNQPNSNKFYDTSDLMKEKNQLQSKQQSSKINQLDNYQNFDNIKMKNSYRICVFQQRYKKHSQALKKGYQDLLKLDEIYCDGLGRNVLKYYKRNIVKCQLLYVTQQKLEILKKILQNDQKAEKYIFIGNYTLSFMAANKMCELELQYKTKREIFQYSQRQSEEFYKFKQYDQLLKIIEFEKNKMFSNLQNLQKKIQNLEFDDEPQFCNILQVNAQISSFFQVKRQYRKIIKKLYQFVHKHYLSNKQKEYAQIGLYLSFSLCIDKLFMRKHFKDNFQPYFQWVKLQKKNLYKKVEKVVWQSIQGSFQQNFLIYD